MNSAEGTTPKETSTDTLSAMSSSKNLDRLRSTSATRERVSQETSRKDYPQHRLLPYTDAGDIDSTPSVSSYEEYDIASDPIPSGTLAFDKADRGHDITTPTASTAQPDSQTRVPSKQARSRPERPDRTVPAKQSPSMLGRAGDFLIKALSPSNLDLEQKLNAREEEIGHLRAELREKDNFIKQISEDFQRKADSLEKKSQALLDDEERRLEFNGKKFERYIEKKERQRDETIRSLQAEIQEIKSDRDLIQANHNTFVRQQQEEAFKQMESARWLPSEDSKVLRDFDRIKRDMKSWAKGTAIKDMSLIRELGEEDVSDFMTGLSTVVLLEENQLPQGLSTPRTPALLLNALLAHDVYTNLFCNPFFFFNDGLGDSLPRTGLGQALNRIYVMAQASDQRDAHMWRSQTLRLLRPPLRNDNREGEKVIRSWTEGLIAEVSNRHVSDFLAGPARCLIDEKAIVNTIKKLKTIYQEAADTSYMLWTRRTTMKLVTLRDMGGPIFDVEKPYLVPHPLVQPENHEDQLRGRPITMIVHPLLQVFGTDEARDYGKGRVWIPAEVWLDSK